MSHPPSTAAVLDGLSPERRSIIEPIVLALRAGMPEGYEEGIQYGMISWYVPHSRYPDGYHCDPKQPVPFVSVGEQKSHVGLYLFCIYLDPTLVEWFTEAWKASGAKLDMGKACVRIKKPGPLPLDVIEEVVRRAPIEPFLAHYTASIPPSAKKKAKPRPAPST